MVYPNKHMCAPIGAGALPSSKYGGSTVLESEYGRQLQASREKDPPLVVDYNRLRKADTAGCECDVSTKEMEETAQQMKRRREQQLFDERSFHVQTGMKEPKDVK